MAGKRSSPPFSAPSQSIQPPPNNDNMTHLWQTTTTGSPPPRTEAQDAQTTVILSFTSRPLAFFFEDEKGGRGKGGQQ